MDIDLKINITWRDIVMRVILVLVSVSVIVWLMPRNTQQNFNIEIGKPWIYSDLTAPFDFPIYKSEATLKAECDSALRDYEPYYILKSDVGAGKVHNFIQDFNKLIDSGYTEYRGIIANRLQALYDKGIINTKQPLEEQEDSLNYLRVINGKSVMRLLATDTYTAKQAYEELTNDPTLQFHRDIFSKLNLNDYLEPNLIYDSERDEASKREIISTVPKASGVVLKGQKIIDRGTIVDEEKYQMLESFQQESDLQSDSETQLSTTVLGETLYVLLLITGFTVFLSIFRAEYFEKMRSIIMIYALIVLFSTMASLLVSHNILHVFIIPFAMVPIFIRVFMDSRTAFMAHMVMVLICACLLQQPLVFIAVETTAGLTAVLSLRDLSSRSQLLWTAGIVMCTSCLMNLDG